MAFFPEPKLNGKLTERSSSQHSAFIGQNNDQNPAYKFDSSHLGQLLTGELVPSLYQLISSPGYSPTPPYLAKTFRFYKWALCSEVRELGGKLAPQKRSWMGLILVQIAANCSKLKLD